MRNGFFVARLGEGTATQDLQTVISGHGQLWVEITIEGNPPDVLLPRTPLTASAYALGGVPTAAAANPILHGNGDPDADTSAPIGAYYVDDADNGTWVRISAGWSRIP